MAALLGYKVMLMGGITVGDLVTCLWLFQRGANEMRTLVQVWKNFNRSIANIVEGEEVMMQEILVKDADKAKPLKISKGAIEFRNVSFDYQGKPAIRNLNLVIPAGKTTALVGHSGAGKSTMAALLMRYYDIKNGGIYIDGQNIAEVTQESLRSKTAFVMQDNSLFHESLKFNIGYGKSNVGQKEIEKAAKKAQIHDFIDSLENKYDTEVGQRGLRLSGGERQRISIARAVLKDAPIMLLDEATSALDSINEGRVQKALKELMKGRTSVVIAHRLSTVKKADLIVVMKNGKIIEKGTHADLLKNKYGYYSKLVKQQVNGLIV